MKMWPLRKPAANYELITKNRLNELQHWLDDAIRNNNKLSLYQVVEQLQFNEEQPLRRVWSCYAKMRAMMNPLSSLMQRGDVAGFLLATIRMGQWRGEEEASVEGRWLLVGWRSFLPQYRSLGRVWGWALNRQFHKPSINGLHGGKKDR